MAQPEQVAAIINEHPEQRIVVTSAPGGLESGDTKMTDLLINYAKEDDNSVRTGLRDNILDRFKRVLSYLSPDEATLLLNEVRQDLLNERVTDQFLVSRGEYYSARGLAQHLGAQFMDAEMFYFGPNGFDRQASDELIKPLGQLSLNSRIIIPGFYGLDWLDNTALFNRGGSDRSGAILASSLGMTYENWTDQDGIYTADPKIVPNARVVPVLSREEVREGAHGGANVLTGDTIRDLNGSAVTTVVKNTFNPEAPGTQVEPARRAGQGESIVALSGRDDLTEITIRDMGMADTPGYVAELMRYMSELGLSFQHLPAAQDAFSITIAAESDKQHEAVQQFADFAQHNLITTQGSVEVSSKGVVYAVGEGLRDPFRRSLAQIRVLGEVVARNLSIEDTVTNRNSPSLAFLVQAENVKPILQAIHWREFERNQQSSTK